MIMYCVSGMLLEMFGHQAKGQRPTLGRANDLRDGIADPWRPCSGEGGERRPQVSYHRGRSASAHLAPRRIGVRYGEIMSQGVAGGMVCGGPAFWISLPEMTRPGFPRPGRFLQSAQSLESPDVRGSHVRGPAGVSPDHLHERRQRGQVASYHMGRKRARAAMRE